MWKGKSFFSHGTTQSSGVIILIGKDIEFVLNDKIVSDNGRYIVLDCNIQGNHFLIVNYYAPNAESDQVKILHELSDNISSIKGEKTPSIIWGGDFNCCMSKDDALGGNFKQKFRTLSLLHALMEEYDLIDIWRVRNPSVNQFTWRVNTPIVQRRLDYFVISDCLQDTVSCCDILSCVFTDHSAITLKLESNENLRRGPAYWRFNTSLLNDEVYVSQLRELIPGWKEEYWIETEQNDPIALWEILKYKIRQFTIKYSKAKQKKIEKK